MVGARGFEPPTTCTPCKHATRLRYAPKFRIIANKALILEIALSSQLYRDRKQEIGNTIHDLRNDTTLSISPCKTVKSTLVRSSGTEE